MNVKKAERCPGKEMFLKSTKSVKGDSLNRLVSRRARQLLEKKLELLRDVKERAKKEKEIDCFFEKISGTANFLPAKFLNDGALCADAVCRVVIRDNDIISGYGTGFLVAPGLVMTNHHVLSSRDNAEQSVLEFGYEEGENLNRVALEPDRFFLADEGLDFAIVACDREKTEKIRPIPLLRNPATVSTPERVNIIQHPRGRKKEVALQENKVTAIMDRVIHYKTDTEPGSSGSPVFNNQWELVALHHAGFVQDGREVTNEGIRISAIVAYLLRLYRDEAYFSDEMVELICSITDSSPYLGFFDIYGVEDSRHIEIEKPDFKGVEDFGDVGFWNIEHFNNSIKNKRVEDVAEVISRLSMDVLGLTEVESGALERLKSALAKRGDSMDYVLFDTNGRQDIAILYDTDTTSVNDRGDIAEKFRDKLNSRTQTGKTAFPRWPLFAECTIRDEASENDVKFMMIVVHLKAFGDAQSRARRRLASKILAEIIEEIRDTEGLSIVLGGDFNERLNNDILNPLKDSPDLFAMTADDSVNSAISYVGSRHRSLIDHIIVSRDVAIEPVSGDDAVIVRLDISAADFAKTVSDHVPVVFRMVLRSDPLDIEPAEDSTKIGIPSDASYLTLKFN